MKTTSRLLTLTVILGLAFSTFACAPSPTPVPTPSPSPATPAASPSPTAAPTQTAVPTRTPTPRPDHTRAFLDALLPGANSCHPDRTAEDIGVYIYDLTDDRELVSVNADVPFQFASAFKGPVLTYFLSSCRAYWDSSSAEWQEHFQDLEAARNIEYYTSADYEQALTEFLSDPKNWKDVGDFSAERRYVSNGLAGDIDTRYFILAKIYGMIAQSRNLATADALKFVYENCLPAEHPQMEADCGGPNALTSFNAWFDQFTGLAYESGAPRRGLYEWNNIVENAADGPREETLSTSGMTDACANQSAVLKCDPSARAVNTYTARDLFQFYSALYRLDDKTLRGAAFRLLELDEPGPARGPLKNLTRSLGAVSLSKNGHAFYHNGSINADAGIVLYKGRAYVIVTLSFNALESMSRLYGQYDKDGKPAGKPGLIQNLLQTETR